MVLALNDDGQGVMISAFQSHEFGFGMQICEEDLKKINENREGEQILMSLLQWQRERQQKKES
jgi:hypothetical protein